MPGFDLIIRVLADAVAALGSRRETPLIAGPMDARNIIDTESAPRVNISERNNLDEGPCGVPQYNFDLCARSLHGVTIQSSTPRQGEAQYDNVPPTCMVLSTVLVGQCDISEGPYPIPCGSACLLYTGVTDEDLDKLNKALGLISNP